MCAINGFNFKDEDLIHKMNQITKHRGPDGSGVFLDDEISLGHNRLSILDVRSVAGQPMSSFDNNEIIIFNGEIYNFKELKTELQNYPFKTEGDTEVILAAYKKWGEECVKKFNGIFAFAIWNKEKRELFLARDHIGIKPFYYFWDGGRLIFSSEIKAILVHNVSRDIDLESLNNYFRLSYIPHPSTIFKNIKKLPAGHLLKLKDGKLEINKFWDIEDRENFFSKKDALLQIKETLKDSVKHQIISDRPVGVFLSGGVDSSIVLGLIREFAPNITKTYTTGFEILAKEEKNKFNMDFELARKTARHYGTDHHEFLINAGDARDAAEKTFWHLDEPNGNSTAPAMFLLSEQARKDVVVVLGGDGGDELFGGYKRYVYSRWISLYQKSPQLFQTALNFTALFFNKKSFVRKAKSRQAERIMEFMVADENLFSKILKPEISQKNVASDYFASLLKKYPEKIMEKDFEKIFMDVDRRTWLTDDSLMRTDKMSMANGLEMRVPILDCRLVGISQKIPTSWKIKGQREKVIFRESFSEYLLPHLINQPKRGWFTPMAKWLREEPLKSFAKEILLSLPDEYFIKENAMKMFEDHLSKKVYNLNILWALIAFGGWYNFFIKGKNSR